MKEPITSEQYAAMLRIARRVSGMVMHPDAMKVYETEEEFGKAIDRQIICANACGLTAEEILAYGRAAAKEMTVEWSEAKCRWLFNFSS